MTAHHPLKSGKPHLVSMADQDSPKVVPSASSSASRSIMATFVLRSACSYFDVSKVVAEGVNDSAPSFPKVQNPTSGQPDFAKNGTSSDHAQQHLRDLDLSGNIISATAQIPYAVATTKDGKFELAPRHERSAQSDALTYLSSSSQWHHTIVAWTGEILPTISAEYRQLLKRHDLSSTLADHGGQLNNIAIHHLSGTDINKTFLRHFKDNDPTSRDICVTKDRRTELETLLEHAFNDKIVPVWMGEWSKEQPNTLILKDQGRWQKYAATALRQDLERLTALSSKPEDFDTMYDDYARLNHSVADAVIKVYGPGDIIWVHDYQLMLLPGILRERLPTAHIMYFHYTAWPPKEVLVTTSKHEDLMRSVIDSSTIGVSSEKFRRYMEEYCLHVPTSASADVGLVSPEDRLVRIIDVPVGVNITEVQRAAFANDEVGLRMKSIRQVHVGKKIIVAQARLHPPTAINSLLDGFAYLISNHADPKDNIVLFLILSDGNKAFNTHQEILASGTASRIVEINSKLGSSIYQPVIFMDGNLPESEYYALLRSADLGIVTSDHEDVTAMSTAFAVCQQGSNNPLLIFERRLTEEKATDLGDAQVEQSLVVAEVAAQIRERLLMDDEQKRKHHDSIYEYFAKHNVATFAEELLAKTCSSLSERGSSAAVPQLDLTALESAYTRADKRLFMFDYDGTLTPIVNDPDAALPTEILLRALKDLAANADNKVWIISGRGSVFLEKLFGNIKGLGLSAEHGCFVRRPGDEKWDNLAACMDMGWKSETDKAFTSLVNNIPGSWVERKEVAIVWHYRNAADHEACLVKAVECKASLEGEILKAWDVEVMLGKANVEVRPRFLNKGVMASDLVQDVFEGVKDGFVLCAGDDTTDEDMFRALLSSKLKSKGIYSCLVAKEPKPSLAYYRVYEPHNLVDAIVSLASH